MLKFFVRAFGLVIAAILALSAFSQQKAHARDEFFWLGQMNKATAVINTDEGLLDKAIAPRIAAGVAKVIEDGNKPGGKRPTTVITFEPLLIKAAGPEVTLLHAGRSSQDMFATYRAAILRDMEISCGQLDRPVQALALRLPRGSSWPAGAHDLGGLIALRVVRCSQ